MKSISVPGKVMLSGEYAVLAGGTAVLAHAPVLLSAHLSEAAPPHGYPPAAHAARRIRISELEDYEKVHGLPHFLLDPGQFFSSTADTPRSKLGLGLSAAEAVAAVALRYEAAGYEWTQHRASIVEHAMAAHREASGGGSGADVAACASAAPVVCSLREEGLHVWPQSSVAKPNVPLALYWSGIPADTRELVGMFLRWSQGDARTASTPVIGEEGVSEQAPAPGRLTAALLRELISASDVLAPAWFNALPDELYRLLDRFDAAMTECALAAGLPYALPVHTRLAAWARRHGGRAKPTGAGGGDMVLLVGDLPLAQLQGLIMPLVF